MMVEKMKVKQLALVDHGSTQSKAAQRFAGGKKEKEKKEKRKKEKKTKHHELKSASYLAADNKLFNVILLDTSKN